MPASEGSLTGKELQVVTQAGKELQAIKQPGTKSQPVKKTRTSRELPLLLRYREAAHELGVTERQILNLINRKLLERVKVGSKTARVTRDSVLKLLETED